MHKPARKHANLCCADWHVGHEVTAVSGFGGNGVKLWCKDCHVLGDAEAVGSPISSLSSREPCEGAVACKKDGDPV